MLGGLVGLDVVGLEVSLGTSGGVGGLGFGQSPSHDKDDDEDQVQIVGDEWDPDLPLLPDEDGHEPPDDEDLSQDEPELGASHHSILFRLRLFAAPPRSLDEDGSSANNKIRRPPDLPDLPLDELPHPSTECRE